MSRNETHLLYGDTLFNSKSGRAIQLLGKGRIGKTTSARRVQELSNGKFLLASSDNTILRLPEKTIVSSNDRLDGVPLSRLIQFTGSHGEVNQRLSDSLLYCMDVLELQCIKFTRVERDYESTAISLLALLNQISG